MPSRRSRRSFGNVRSNHGVPPPLARELYKLGQLVGVDSVHHGKFGPSHDRRDVTRIVDVTKTALKLRVLKSGFGIRVYLITSKPHEVRAEVERWIAENR